MNKVKTSNDVYFEHEGTVLDKKNFSHVMALSLNPNDRTEGLIRCITARKGNVAESGFVDRSVLYKVKSIDGYERFEITSPVSIKNTDEIIRSIAKGQDFDFIGLEDPDIIYDEDSGKLHVYFTIPLLKYTNEKKGYVGIFLGHAEGDSLDTLEMAEPVLKPQSGDGAKELAVAPINSNGIRLNLIESRDVIGETYYSTVRQAISKSYNPPWEMGKTLLHPKNDGYPWCAEHMSPGPMLPQSFVDVGNTRRLGILNGREKSRMVDGKKKYGMFSVGLYIYDFENGKVDWISPEPLIIDSEANTITFASDFVDLGNGEILVYAHVDDSFVRAYTLYGDKIKEMILSVI